MPTQSEIGFLVGLLAEDGRRPLSAASVVIGRACAVLTRTQAAAHCTQAAIARAHSRASVRVVSTCRS